jgi:hypothetical protein
MATITSVWRGVRFISDSVQILHQVLEQRGDLLRFQYRRGYQQLRLLYRHQCRVGLNQFLKGLFLNRCRLPRRDGPRVIDWDIHAHVVSFNAIHVRLLIGEHYPNHVKDARGKSVAKIF